MENNTPKFSGKTIFKVFGFLFLAVTITSVVFAVAYMPTNNDNTLIGALLIVVSILFLLISLFLLFLGFTSKALSYSLNSHPINKEDMNLKKPVDLNGANKVRGVIKCDKCGFLNDQDDLYCQKCGQRLDNQKVVQCPSCHHEVSASAAFCPHCGTKLN